MIDIKEAATRKIGPLPAWAWGAVIGGGLLVYGLVSGKGASSPFTQTLANADGEPFDYAAGSGGGGGGGGTGSPSDGTVATPVPVPPVTGTPVTPLTPSPSVSPVTRLVPSTRDVRATLVPTPPTVTIARSTQRTRPGTGDTSPLPLGLPLPRWDAIAAVQDALASSYLALPPIAPSQPIPVPGTVSKPTLPPIITMQGDTRRFDPRGWRIAFDSRARADVVPTTIRRSITLPPRVARAIGATLPRQTG